MQKLLRLLHFLHVGDGRMGKSGKRRLAGIAVMVTAGIVCAALLSEKGGVKVEESEERTAVLPVWIGGGDASWENCMNEVAAAYMELHPEVEVRVRTVANVENTDYDKGLIIETALGNFEGIVEMRNAQRYVQEGLLAPLPDELTEKIKQVKEIDGEVYSVPRYYSVRGMIYNKSIFRELGLGVPENYEEFLGVCRTLKEHGIAPLAVGAGDLWHLDHWCNLLFAMDVSRQNPGWLKLCSEGEAHWTDDGPVQMLLDFQELFEEGYVEENYAETTDAETIELLTEGRAAMLCSGPWLFSQILKTDPEFEIGWFFLPDREGKLLLEQNGDWEWAVASSCEVDGTYDAAVDFLKFYYSRDIYGMVLQSMNGCSACTEDIRYRTIPAQEEILKAVQEEKEPKTTSVGTAGTPEGFASIWYNEMLKMAKGVQTVEETADKLEEEWSRCLEKEQ